MTKIIFFKHSSTDISHFSFIKVYPCSRENKLSFIHSFIHSFICSSKIFFQCAWTDDWRCSFKKTKLLFSPKLSKYGKWQRWNWRKQLRRWRGRKLWWVTKQCPGLRNLSKHSFNLDQKPQISRFKWFIISKY